MFDTTTKILRTAGLLACSSMIAIGVSMGPGAVTTAMAAGAGFECEEFDNAGDGGAMTDDSSGFACGTNADATDPTGTAVNASAIGNETTAAEDGATAVGYSASVSDGAFRGVAVGAFANIDESDNAIAIGGGNNSG